MNWITHEVVNQPVPLADTNLFEHNVPLREALAHHAPQLDTAPLAALGRAGRQRRDAGPCAAGQHA